MNCEELKEIFELYALEPQPLQQTGQRTAGVGIRGLQNPIHECRLLHLPLRLLAHLRFQIRIDRDEQPRLP